MNEFNLVVDDVIVHEPFGLVLVLLIPLAAGLPASIALFALPFIVMGVFLCALPYNGDEVKVVGAVTAVPPPVAADDKDNVEPTVSIAEVFSSILSLVFIMGEAKVAIKREREKIAYNSN